MKQPSLIQSHSKLNKDNLSRLEKISRYAELERVVNKDKQMYVESPNDYVIASSNKDVYHKVQVGEVNRIDIISTKYYGTPLLYWAICKANHIENPLILPVGVVLRIPHISNIYDSGVIVHG